MKNKNPLRWASIKPISSLPVPRGRPTTSKRAGIPSTHSWLDGIFVYRNRNTSLHYRGIVRFLKAFR